MMYFNNPLNIRSGSKWIGLRGNKNGFCEFKSLVFGVRAALYLLLKNYPKHGALTVADCISRWAPPSENNTQSYINFVCKNAHLSPDDVVKDLSPFYLYLLLFYMCKMESGTYLPEYVFNYAYRLI